MTPSKSRPISHAAESGGSTSSKKRAKTTACSGTTGSAEPLSNTTTDSAVGSITILDSNSHYLVVAKPPSVVCHHSDYTGSKARMEIPMLQRTRDALRGERINLIHRLDRGCSGCLLMAFENSVGATTELQDALSSKAQKTYLALVRGEGVVSGRDFRKEGWFKVDRPIKDERNILNDATTWFRFVAGQDNGNGTLDRPRASLVLCRPETGRWHQIRRHLNGLSHPILGDSTHGDSRTNKEWRKRGLIPERTCLHLIHLKIDPTPTVCPDGIDVTCPLALDMMDMLRNHLSNVLEESEQVLKEEGILLTAMSGKTKIIPYDLRKRDDK